MYLRGITQFITGQARPNACGTANDSSLYFSDTCKQVLHGKGEKHDIITQYSKADMSLKQILHIEQRNTEVLWQKVEEAKAKHYPSHDRPYYKLRQRGDAQYEVIYTKIYCKLIN